MFCSPEIKPDSKTAVVTSFQTSDHLPISNIFPISLMPPEPTQSSSCSKWREISDWEKTDLLTFQGISDGILTKIKVPFQLLSQKSSISVHEQQILLNIYYAEIVHALRVAEHASVPVRRFRVGTEKPGWSGNPDIVDSCVKSKFWFHIWRECGRPRSGVVNEIRLYTKRYFAKVLKRHQAKSIAEMSSKAKSDPNFIWKVLRHDKSKSCSDVQISTETVVQLL